MHDDTLRSNDREYCWHSESNVHISPENNLLLFCFFDWHLLALIQGGGGGGGECARGRNRGRARRNHVEASSSGMEAGGGVQS